MPGPDKSKPKEIDSVVADVRITKILKNKDGTLSTAFGKGIVDGKQVSVFINGRVVKMNAPQVACHGNTVQMVLDRELYTKKGRLQSKAIDIARPVLGKWKDHQLNSRLPNTTPGADVHLDFACASCGVTVVKRSNIYKLKEGAIWTKNVPRTILVGDDDSSNFNKDKDCVVHQAFCDNCNINLGAVYLSKYGKDDPDEEHPKTFPCCKLLYRRLRQDGARVNHLAITNEDKDVVQHAINACGYERPHLFHTTHALKQVLEEEGSLAVPPKYWKSDGSKATLQDRTRAWGKKVERLMNETSDPSSHGLGRDSHKVKFDNFRVTKVMSVENLALWKKFCLERQKVQKDVKAHSLSTAIPHAPPRTQELTDGDFFPFQLDNDDEPSPFIDTVGEAILFHGTQNDRVDYIINSGFDDRYGNLLGLFGSGIYLAENSSKSDQYSRDKGFGAMFLVRAVLGHPMAVNKTYREMRLLPKITPDDPKSPSFHSLVGNTKKQDPEAFLKRFREFVIYERAQVYPEAIIYYTRE